MSDANKSDDLPFLDDLPYTPTPEQEPERPPAPESADRTAPKEMQRYSVYLIVAAFLLMGLNYDALSLSAVLWFAAGLSAGFAILCAVAVVLLNAVAWNFDRLREELRGGRESIDLRE
ncbi:MAG: hypothetical protein P8Z36_00920 [Gemmatimonadota bacterium]